MAVSKVDYGGETLIDLTNDTVTPETLEEGQHAHAANGEKIVGTMPTTTVLYTAQNLTEAQKTQARENIGVDEAFKAELVQYVLDSIGCPFFGVVDENNNIILNGALPDGTYIVKYEMEDGSQINIGNLVLDTNVYYSVTNTLTNCTSNNSAKQVVEGESYSATITAKDGYEISSIKVTMGGTDISSSAVSGGKITIANVTGKIVITAVAEEIKAKYTNLANPSSADWAPTKRINSSGGLSDGASNTVATNYIGPVKSGDVIRVKGIDLTSHNSPPYKSDKTLTSYGSGKLATYPSTVVSSVNATTTGGEFTVGSYADLQNGYWRFSGILNGTSQDVIITINEPIE